MSATLAYPSKSHYLPVLWRPQDTQIFLIATRRAH